MLYEILLSRHWEDILGFNGFGKWALQNIYNFVMLQATVFVLKTLQHQKDNAHETRSNFTDQCRESRRTATILHP
jgi:hypothetical protein